MDRVNSTTTRWTHKDLLKRIVQCLSFFPLYFSIDASLTRTTSISPSPSSLISTIHRIPGHPSIRWAAQRARLLGNAIARSNHHDHGMRGSYTVPTTPVRFAKASVCPKRISPRGFPKCGGTKPRKSGDILNRRLKPKRPDIKSYTPITVSVRRGRRPRKAARSPSVVKSHHRTRTMTMTRLPLSPLCLPCPMCTTSSNRLNRFSLMAITTTWSCHNLT